MQHKIINFTAENRVMQMQLEENRNRNYDFNMSMTRESSPAHDSRREGEIDYLKKKSSDLEIQVKQLKDELHASKVDKEKYHDKYELALEDNRVMNEQVFNLKKLMLELEKKDFSIVKKLQTIEGKQK